MQLQPVSHGVSPHVPIPMATQLGLGLTKKELNTKFWRHPHGALFPLLQHLEESHDDEYVSNLGLHVHWVCFNSSRGLQGLLEKIGEVRGLLG